MKVCEQLEVFPPPSVIVHVTVFEPNKYGPGLSIVTLVPTPVVIGVPIEEVLVHIPASVLMFAIEGQVTVGDALTVTLTIMSVPGHPIVEEITDMVYCTTAFPVPVFVNISVIDVDPPRLLPFPVAEPEITVEFQLKSLLVTEDKPMAVVPPLNMVSSPVEIPTGVAPTLSVTVNELPKHPNEDLGITV